MYSQKFINIKNSSHKTRTVTRSSEAFLQRDILELSHGSQNRLSNETVRFVSATYSLSMLHFRKTKSDSVLFDSLALCGRMNMPTAKHPLDCSAGDRHSQ